MMRRLSLSLAGLGAFVVLSACDQGVAPAAPVNSDMVARSLAAADLFQARLQSALADALASGGPVGAVQVCAEVAPTIAADVSRETGAALRRVSLRPRNPAAAANDALAMRLEALASEPLDASGRPALITWTDGEGSDATFNTLRAVIMREQPCSACHGTSIADEVRTAISGRYPLDEATGFRPGELRGAILVSWLQQASDETGEPR